MKIKKALFYSLTAIILMGFQTSTFLLNAEETSIYNNILITNDNGIEDLPLLVMLAKAVRKYSDNVVVVVANEDKSGTSNQITINKRGSIATECVIADPKNRIWVYSADGYPADCVILGAAGIFMERGSAPDLVISGINGGANEGPFWFGSGTVGAARTAAFVGIPAIAVSGIHKSDPIAQKSVSAWVAEFIKTDMVRSMKPPEYFTVSVPKDLKKIIGTKLVERDISISEMMLASLVRENKSPPKVGQKDNWTFSIKRNESYRMVHKRDLYYYMMGYIVIVPMTIDENNYRIQKKKESLDTQLPGFKILK